MKSDILQETLGTILKNIEKDGIQKIVVGAVIFVKDNALLLLKRKADDFMGGLVELPSGTLESNEDILIGLKREIKEETNLDIKSVDAYIGAFDYLSGSGKKTRQLNFRVTTTDANIKLSEEHETFYLCAKTSEEYKKLNISEKTREIIEKA